jgi:LmbE family N-acetylglucosaminyl deacetylase
VTHDLDANPLGTILGVWGHPDDESWLSAGLMARAARAGDRVVCVTATRGELGSPDEAMWPPGPPLAAVRTKELEACFALLGVKEHHWLDYPDGGCRDVDQDEAVRRVSEIMAEVQPDTVLTFGPDGMTGHDDHKAVCAWATAAFRDVGKPGAVLGYATNTPEWLAEYRPHLEKFNVFMGAEPPCTPRDDLLFFVDLAGDELATKLAAMRVMTSQVTGLIDGLGEDFFRSGLAEESFRRP